ncbi:hypothetical protein BP6252_11500 [Coleophoma cylindrospora]|uniref:Major facilitator superfamily (MFS) profile domain-containing protein n=1 Tax=Coleophoma cylindrospora TaxID=1849047 RepID=A0A3D8QJY9_9HELO|nr:hypothetical protein BP6252_11500 [Coleophoma cylindrospora]
MVYTIVIDFFPLHKRASVFFLLSGAVLLGEVLATPLSAFLMSWTPWCPALLGLFMEVLGFMAALALPETRPEPSENDSHEDRATDNKKPWNDVWSGGWSKFRVQAALSANMLCIMGAFLMAGIGRQALQFMLQYASKRFGWSIARASFLITLKGIIDLVLLLVLLPRLSQVLAKHMSAVFKDLHITQGSALDPCLWHLLLVRPSL